MNQLVLSPDQQEAEDDFIGFIGSPTEQVFVLEGYAGTGKTTLVDRILTDLPATLATVKLITQNHDEWEVILTATTNKACEALSLALSDPTRKVQTIQSFLKLRPVKDHASRSSRLLPADPNIMHENKIIFIDEASFVDHDLLDYIFRFTKNCKIVFVGDPAQLAPIKAKGTPVFDAGFKTASLSTVVRQAAGNPIIDLATSFRNTVNGLGWFQFTPDGHHITHLSRQDFEDRMILEFNRPDWRHNDSKVLAYTNKTVVAYNQAIRNIVEGIPELEAGDYAICNQYINTKKCRLKTDQMVEITDISSSREWDTDGWLVTMDAQQTAFMPSSLAARKAKLAAAHSVKDWNLVNYIENSWVDLRAAYACTINKSQGSTYDKVFIDLEDLKKCTNANTLARLMYVGVSRARYEVYMTGDLV